MAICPRSVIRGSDPTAVQSKLGYLLSGPLPSVRPNTLINLRTYVMLLSTIHAKNFPTGTVGKTPSIG